MARILVKVGEDTIQALDLGLDPVVIGRDLENDITLDHVAISMRHARITYDAMAGCYVLHDLGSRNGVLHNGKRITSCPMRDGDSFNVAKYSLVFQEFLSNITKPEEIVAYQEARKGFMDKTMVQQKTVQVMLTVKEHNQDPYNFRITKHETVLGSGEGADIRIRGWFVRRRHAVIRAGGATFAVFPVGATFVNEERVRGRHLLRNGDLIRIRRNVIRFAGQTEQDE